MTKALSHLCVSVAGTSIRSSCAVITILNDRTILITDLCFYRDDYSIKAVSFWLTQVAASNGPEIAEAYVVTVPAFYSKILKGIEPFKSGPAVVPMLGELACNYLRNENYSPDLETVLSVMKSYTLRAKL